MEQDAQAETLKAGFPGAYDTSLVSDAMDRLGLDGVPRGVVGVAGPGRLVGRVRTVTLGPARGARPARHLGTATIDSVRPGEVLVIATGGREASAGWGELLSRAALARGAAGAIVDGLCRDVDAITALGWPVFARGTTPVSARGRLVETGRDEPVAVAGVRVRPGDFVVADGTGVVFVPSDRAREVSEITDALADEEARLIQRIERGHAATAVLGPAYERDLRGAR